MKRAEILQLNAAMNTAAEKGNLRFKHIMLSNLDMIESEAERLGKLVNEPEKIKEPFNKARQEYFESISKGRLSIKQTDPDFQEVMSHVHKLETVDFKADFEAYESKLKELEVILNEESEKEYTFIKVAFEQLPDDLTKTELQMLRKCGIAQEPA
jgi:hypothetical protein